VRISYRAGGGAAGNRPPGTIVELRSAIPYIDGVTNHEPAEGGAPREPIDRLRARAPQALRHRDRAVTAQDLEDLALAASTAVARATAVTPRFDPTNLWLDPEAPVLTGAHHEVQAGRAGVIVVPTGDAARPTPGMGLLRQVQAFLRERCPPAADVWIAGPEWVRVTVTATIVPTSLEAGDAVGLAVEEALERFLHPLTGGSPGRGWAFGRKPHRSDLFALIEGLAGVDHLASLDVAHEPETRDENLRLALHRALDQSLAEAHDQPPAAELRRWLDRSLVYSGRHEITVALPG
jgi:predicted phage baseplate assembly protein